MQEEQPSQGSLSRFTRWPYRKTSQGPRGKTWPLALRGAAAHTLAARTLTFGLTGRETPYAVSTAHHPP